MLPIHNNYQNTGSFNFNLTLDRILNTLQNLSTDRNKILLFDNIDRQNYYK